MTFQPDRVAISNITQANPAVVTTSVNHNMTTGQVVRTIVPQNYGMVELNKQQLQISVLSPTTFSLQASQNPFINVNSTSFTAFTTPSKPSKTAEVLPIGSGPTPLTNTQPQITNGVCDSLLGDATSNNSTVSIPF